VTHAHVNAEFKARCSDPQDAIRRVRAAGARWLSREHQVDTYYRVSEGRLKVRETGSRAELVWYFRPDTLRSKRSDVLLLAFRDASSVKATLARALGVKVVVDKVRRIYIRDSVRVHIDKVRDLGTFVEIEAVGESRTFKRLQNQAEAMAQVLGLRRSDLIRGSYSDLLLAKPLARERQIRMPGSIPPRRTTGPKIPASLEFHTRALRDAGFRKTAVAWRVREFRVLAGVR
jgi:adenylate cyclase, class 2